MPRMGFEHMIQMFQLLKEEHVLDTTATILLRQQVAERHCFNLSDVESGISDQILTTDWTTDWLTNQPTNESTKQASNQPTNSLINYMEESHFEKPILPHLIRKFPAGYWDRTVVTIFITAPPPPN